MYKLKHNINTLYKINKNKEIPYNLPDVNKCLSDSINLLEQHRFNRGSVRKMRNPYVKLI